MLLVRRRLALRAFVAALIGTARHVGTTAAMSSAAAAMQRKTIALALVTIRLLSLRRRTGDERWQTQILFLRGAIIILLRLAVVLAVVVLPILLLAIIAPVIELAILVPALAVVTIVSVVAIFARLVIALLIVALLVRLITLLALLITLLLPRLELLLIARRVRLHAAVSRLRIVAFVVAFLAATALLAAFRSREGLGLAELLLRRRNQAEIMLRVLIIVFGSHRIAGRGRVARKLDVFLGYMVCGAADLYVRAVRFVNPGERIVALAAAAVATPHPMLVVLSVSHGLPVCKLQLARVHRVSDRQTSVYSPNPASRDKAITASPTWAR